LGSEKSNACANSGKEGGVIGLVMKAEVVLREGRGKGKETGVSMR